MEKQEIFKKLGRTIKAPTNICFTITDQVMYINLKVKEKCNNMQEDNSSFEAWMLCIMSKFHTEIDKVVLNWDECEQKDGHYNRFMYRVMKSCEYFNWFCVSDSKKQVLSEFRAQFESAFLVLNFPEKEAKVSAKKNSEAHIERMFINSKKLYKNIEFEYIDQQLPVGVFKNEVKKNTAFFTAGKSAIDLWAIKGDEFWIFELKFNNKQVGIITELLFYMWLSQDMFEHKLNYIITDRPSAIRSFDKLYQFRENGKTKNFVGVMLYDKIHPLIDTDVIDYINIQFKNKPLQIKTQEYSIKQELI